MSPETGESYARLSLERTETTCAENGLVPSPVTSEITQITMAIDNPLNIARHNITYL